MTIIFTNGKHTQKVEPSQFPHEGKLQEYISDNPECLPIYDIDEDATLMIVGREFYTNHGPIDVLGIDAKGNIYIVETKLFKNPDKRKVIAQLLDYGASLWDGYASTDEFISALNRHLQGKGQTLNNALSAAFEYDENEGPSDTIETIQKNFQAGQFRFVVLMDHIDDRLKTLITFINMNSRFDIYAVELEYYETPQGDVLIPELYGVRPPGTGTKPPTDGGASWNHDRFFADAKQQLREDEFEAVKTLYDYSVKHPAEIRWGRGKEVGTFHPKFSEVRTGGKQKWWSPFSGSSDGTLTINTFRAKTKANAEMCKTVLEALANHQILGVPVDTKQKITLPIGQWKGQVKEFMLAIDEALSSIKRASGKP